MRRLSVLAAAGLLAACSSTDLKPPALNRADAGPMQLGRAAARTDPLPTGSIVVADESVDHAILALPAEAGRGGRLDERQYANGWRQSQSLDGRKFGGDWNDLAIDLRMKPGSGAGKADIPMGKPTQEGVRKEILARFPGVPMRVVGRPMSNALGPFGLAVGAAGTVRCAFAWQWVDDMRHPAGAKSFFAASGPAASIRMRLCRENVTADQLAALFERLEVGNADRIDRVAQLVAKGDGTIVDHGAPPGAVAIADTAGPVVSLESTLVGARPIATQPAETKVAAAHRHRRAHFTRRAAPAPQEAAPTNGAPQYLAPVGAATGLRGAAYAAGSVDPNLPAQAYQGPSAQRPASPPQYLGR